MKTIGDKAKEFRLDKKWNTTQMATHVGTSRQNIENLEEKGDMVPRYVAKLAKALGVTVDSLVSPQAALLPAAQRGGGDAIHESAAVPSKANPLAESLADKTRDLGEMLAIFTNEDILNMAYLKCVMAIEEFKLERSYRENKLNLSNTRLGVTPAVAPRPSTGRRR